MPNPLCNFHLRSPNESNTSLYLFSDIYDLCVIGMYSITEQVQSPAKKVGRTNDISHSEWPLTEASTDLHNFQQLNITVVLSTSQVEEERHREKLYAQLQSIGITALELVSGIKTLIAKESSLNTIKERLKLINRYK